MNAWIYLPNLTIRRGPCAVPAIQGPAQLSVPLDAILTAWNSDIEPIGSCPLTSTFDLSIHNARQRQLLCPALKPQNIGGGEQGGVCI